MSNKKKKGFILAANGTWMPAESVEKMRAAHRIITQVVSSIAVFNDNKNESCVIIDALLNTLVLYSLTMVDKNYPLELLQKGLEALYNYNHKMIISGGKRVIKSNGNIQN
jgi:hypothetical protein